MTAANTPKRTVLFEKHRDAGATLVDFGGFEMPVRYSSDKAEHLAVRQAVGVFDVSHMGEVFIEGEGALAAVQRLFTNDATAIKDGQAMYCGMLNEAGGFIDDCVVYRFHPQKFLVCVNAGNREKDWAHISAVVEREFSGRATARDEGEAWAQIAVQGPKAEALVADLCGDAVRQLAFYHFSEGEIAGHPGVIARTGYTGEDGFELYLPAAAGPAVWDALFASDAAGEVTPCGLAARDTLRLEAGMALYGNDIDEEHTPVEAGLNFIVKLDKAVPEGERPFIGHAALVAQKERGLTRRLRGLEMVGRGIARHGYRVLDANGEAIGEVTSGTQAPFLKRAIAMAWVNASHMKLGTTVFVEVRNKPVEAKVVKLPFYKRAR